MVLSMTGFGSAVVELPSKKFIFEIKSLNSKQLDLSTRIPTGYRAIEADIRNVIAPILERGKAEFNMYVETTGSESAVQLNIPVLKAYKAQIEHASAELGIPMPDDWYGVLLRFPDTVKSESASEVDETERDEILKGAAAAALPAAAFATVFPRFHYMVSVSLILFAATSIMSQWYFGHVSLLYLKSKRGAAIYRILFPILIMLGGLSTADMVWYMQDCMLGLLIIPNIIALFILSPTVRKTTMEFLSKSNH